jgi:hypothetical protein
MRPLIATTLLTVLLAFTVPSTTNAQSGFKRESIRQARMAWRAGDITFREFTTYRLLTRMRALVPQATWDVVEAVVRAEAKARGINMARS